MFADHDGIDYKRTGKRAAGDGFDDAHSSQGARLGCLRGQIFKNGIDLPGHERGCEHLHVRNPGGVLDGDQRNRSSAEYTKLVKSLEVRLYTCASAGVGASDAERDRNSHYISTGFSRGITISCHLLPPFYFYTQQVRYDANSPFETQEYWILSHFES